MPDIVFRAKVETIHNMDDTVAFRHVKVPNLARRHCDMAAFRADHRYSSYANSDLFPAMLGRAVKALGVGEHIRMDAIPSGVSVDTSGFLADRKSTRLNSSH